MLIKSFNKSRPKELTTGEPTLITWDLNKLYTLEMNSECAELSEDVIERIMKCIITAVAVQGKFVPLKIASLIQEIEWQWKSTRGSLPKRVGKWLKDNHDVTMPEELSTAIGNIVRESQVKDQTYYFDFVKKFDWEAGDFADTESCFWKGGTRGDVLPAMQKDPRFYAMRFFKREKQRALKREHSKTVFYVDGDYFHRGIGRIWVCADSIKHLKKSVPLYITFNGYGLTTAQGTAVFASYKSLSTSRIGLLNNKQYDGDLYTNEGGVAVGESSAIAEIKNYDFGLDTNEFLVKVEKKTIDTSGKLDKEQKYTHNGAFRHWRAVEQLPKYYKAFGENQNKKKSEGISPPPFGEGILSLARELDEVEDNFLDEVEDNFRNRWRVVSELPGEEEIPQPVQF